MFLSLRQAKAEVRKQTNLTHDECAKIVTNLPARTSGKRSKVHLYQLRDAIAEANAAPAIATDIKPLSPRSREKFQARGK